MNINKYVILVFTSRQTDYAKYITNILECADDLTLQYFKRICIPC